ENLLSDFNTAGSGKRAAHAALLAACADRDRDALRRLYDLDAAFLLGVALRIVRRRPAAEDVLHDAFVRIWTKAAGFDPARDDARAWMAAIVRRRALDRLREEGHGGPLDETGHAGRPDGDGAPDPLDALLRLREDGALRACLERLDGGMRAGLLLAYLDGLSYGQIAARLGVPLGTAKTWVRRGLLALGACLR
ncbi:MAG TPA: sigma-70 family RNA polymerase sigma factor, partial [Geminicoccaceae bacterium]|nr:sigma-70 family RNA polymerase sigma factor [Geminicoccaceae bacterium]